MSGIPVHTSSPLVPSKSATTATTASSKTSTTPPPATSGQLYGTPATSTLSSSTASQYTPAQPGASAVPAPTGAPPRALPVPTSTTPTVPTTTSTQQESPPPPQPGAVPTPPQTSLPPSQSSIPPPPRAGDPPPLLPHQQEGKLVDPTITSRAQPPASTTTTATRPQSQSVDLSHPPGYVQDSHTSFQDRQVDAYKPLQNLSETNGRSPADGLLGNNQEDSGGGKGWLDTATEWTKKAGEKLSDGHDEIWRRINNEK